MDGEIKRQLVHLAGFLSVLLAFYIGRLIAVYFFMAAFVFWAYSFYIKRERERLNLLEKLETRFRNVLLKFERKDIPRPFMGAIWFFFTAGLAFLIFPLDIASASVFMLSIGDSFSTLVGIHFGRHKIVGKKSLEGTLACFLGCLFTLLIIPPLVVVPGAVAATLAEILPDIGVLKNLKNKGWIDDNFLIPIIAGAVMLAAAAL